MQLYFQAPQEWRDWLEANHDRVGEVWMVFYKTHAGVPTITYEDAVEEALCFGWIDSLIRRLDDDRYARKFTPRTNTTRWSAANLRRMAKLEAEGRMTPVGRAKLDPSTTPDTPPSARTLEVPGYFQEALDAEPAAREFFSQLAPSYRRQFVGWVISAKREATRQRRLAEAIATLARGEKLGMK
jgi:uncharacterized protein YdeI (YjbR/CyaY-like superfamily)